MSAEVQGLIDRARRWAGVTGQSSRKDNVAMLLIASLEAQMKRADNAELALKEMRDAVEISVDNCPQCDGKGDYYYKNNRVPCEFCEISRGIIAS